MRTSTMALALLVLAATGTSTAELAPSPTALESFLARPSVVLDLAVDVGSIRSSTSTVTVAAVIGTDTAQPDERMQGVRVTLEDNGGIEQAWLDETDIRTLLMDLDGIEGGIAELKAGTDAPWRTQGTASCWRPKEPRRILCPNFHVGPDGTGFGLGAYGSRGFNFPDLRPSEFAALIQRAVERLRGQ